jgi:hypothetical protein
MWVVLQFSVRWCQKLNAKAIQPDAFSKDRLTLGFKMQRYCNQNKKGAFFQVFHLYIEERTENRDHIEISF